MKLIENYFIKKNKSGIISLLINTIDKWQPFHEYSKGSYIIGYENNLEYLTINIELFQFEPNVKYLTTICQNKDQISFYYIPYELILDKNNSAIIYSSKTNENDKQDFKVGEEDPK